jgi:SnoaL-like protein
MSDIDPLEARLAALEDREAIRELKHRYWRCLDLKRWDELAACFAPDATVSYGNGKYAFRGVDAIMTFLRKSLGRETGMLGVHHGGQPEITLTGPDTARATWALYNYLFNHAQGRAARLSAFYEDEYVKQGGAWRIRHTGYTTVFHEEWSRSDTPSVRMVESI